MQQLTKLVEYLVALLVCHTHTMRGNGGRTTYITLLVAFINTMKSTNKTTPRTWSGPISQLVLMAETVLFFLINQQISKYMTQLPRMSYLSLRKAAFGWKDSVARRIELVPVCRTCWNVIKKMKTRQHNLLFITAVHINYTIKLILSPRFVVSVVMYILVFVHTQRYIGREENLKCFDPCFIYAVSLVYYLLPFYTLFC